MGKKLNVNFKVGDKVVIITDIGANSVNIGDIATISRVNTSDYYAKMDKNGEEWYVDDEHVVSLNIFLNNDNTSIVVSYEPMPTCLTTVRKSNVNDRVELNTSTLNFEPFRFIITDNKITCEIILKDGSGIKASARCHPEDRFDIETGMKIAYNRANTLKLQRELMILTK